MPYKITENVAITFDMAYQKEILDHIQGKYGSNVKRVATHVSDLLMCLRKSWGKHNIPEENWSLPDPEDDPMVMWSQGLQFEDLIASGEAQVPQAYCWTCKAVSGFPTPLPDPEDNDRRIEQPTCGVCGNRWLVGTPDFRVPTVVDGEVKDVIHEAKQTRKSQRKGPMEAPWWLEQLMAYLLFERKAQPTEAPNDAELVVNWLMGDYGQSKKGLRPRPPKSVIEPFKVEMIGDWDTFEAELKRRQEIVDGDELPPLTGMDLEVDSPRYDFECSTCPVGRVLGCEKFIWDEDDNEMKKPEPPEMGATEDQG